MLKVLDKNTEAVAAFAATTYSTAVDLNSSKGGCTTWATVASVTSAAATAHIFAPSAVDATANTITSTAHGYVTGRKLQFTTVTTLPAGLSTSTDYFVIKVDADTFKVATTLILALAGTAVDITDQGVGNHTATPVALAGGTCKVQLSVDNLTFVDKASSSQNITATTDLYFGDTDPGYRYTRLAFTCTAGQLSASIITLQKG